MTTSPHHSDAGATRSTDLGSSRLAVQRRLVAGTGAVLASLVLAACGSSGPGTTADAPASAPASGTTTATGPVSVENCGRTVQLDAPAQRIVSGWATSSEVLLELGQGQRLVGQYNTSASAPSAAYADALADVPVLNDAALSREQLAAARPDLILADGSYLFDGTQLPTVDELAAQGTQVLVLSGFCTDDATGATVDDAFTDLDNIATLTGSGPTAETLDTQLHQRLQAAADRIHGQTPVPLVFLANYEGVLYTYDGVYTDIAARAGGQNLYAGQLPQGQYYSEVSREDVLAKDPGTIVLLTGADVTDAAGVDAAKAALAGLLPGASAVRDGRVVTMPDTDSTNQRVVDGVEELSEALHP